MNFRIINDIHIGSPLATHSFEEIIEAIRSTPEDTTLVTLGDIVDMKNCKKSEVDLHLGYLKSIWQEKGIHIRGNHELNQIQGPDARLLNQIYFCHSDIEFWGKERAFKFRSKQPGASFFKRHFIVDVIDDLRTFVSPGPNKLFTQNVSYIKHVYGAKLIVCGHRHPSTTLIGLIDGVGYMILPRGIHDLEL